jgi:aryl-alcohol dehydrogenase-like predicted oxidoreductase
MSLIDTSGDYGNGRSERLIGRAIAGQRDRVFLVSKVEADEVYQSTHPERYASRNYGIGRSEKLIGRAIAGHARKPAIVAWSKRLRPPRAARLGYRPKRPQMPYPIMPRFYRDRWREMALRITGSRELANASRVLPLIPTRHFLISAQPSDQLTFEWISVKTWVY